MVLSQQQDLEMLLVWNGAQAAAERILISPGWKGTQYGWLQLDNGLAQAVECVRILPVRDNAQAT